MKKFVRLVCLLFVMASVATSWSQEKVDLETTGRIRYEGFHNSKVMEYATGLMDSIGERLTGSPNMKRANEWTRDQLTAAGRATPTSSHGVPSVADGPINTSTLA